MDIVSGAKEFRSSEVAYTYMIVRWIRDWQKETGGTLDELLDYMDEMCPKKQK